MRSTTVLAILSAAAGLVSAAPASTDDTAKLAITLKARGVQVPTTIPAQCTVCGIFSAGCIAACIAGGPLDPVCDLCAAGSWTVLNNCITCIVEEA